ncbi:PD-(D/E)XK nuclease family protein [Hydromonas duriensis]|uniref:DNA helicase/exodeoxyribonuclease V subunit B n=1 Tax=Hydromonas duriensis TaxID=1527608 RepID=A0A4V3DJI5_9BURK|nr:PD-(D/E)XK nuclease family protein [Hydromonas duriensis]TDR29091.1 DNA helicase/exodeoxyribonuclease V subunit B [Hydromonas duriensis]
MHTLTYDLFPPESPQTSEDEPWTKHNCVFDDVFWSDVVERMWHAAEKNTVALQSHMMIVPDASMYVPFQKAWAKHAYSLNRPCVMPRMMTLLDWAKSAGASDIDMQHTERVLNWMGQLRNTQQLAEWLGVLEEVHLFDVARALIDMSDELSLQLLAGQNLADGEAALLTAVETVFERHAGVFAQQELSILLQCWRADVSAGAEQLSPVLKFLETLQQFVRHPPVKQVWVVRNRPWARFETWFWQAYAQASQVHLLDVTQVRARVDDARLQQLHTAWLESIRISSADTPIPQGTAKIVQAESLEDEAQAVTQQVLAWRAQGLQKIALVALDRQVSRRVWALLARCGVSIRDDTGWLLATARAASSWRAGLTLWQGEVLAVELLDWLSHPMVLGMLPASHKSLLIRHVQHLAMAQPVLARDWQAWLNLASSQSVRADLQIQAENLQMDLRQSTIDVFGKALNIQASWRRTFSLSQWAVNITKWSYDFGLYQGWTIDPAGQVWLQLLEKWRCATVKAPLDLSTFLRIADSEVEASTFRPHDVSDDVLLLPLGSTRMRHFDAVWLMGADANNLPGVSNNVGLLNMAVRLQLGLPTHLEQQEQAKNDLIDVFATTPHVVASFCGTQDSAPNAISAWLAQWLRAGQMTLSSANLTVEHVKADLHPRSQVSIEAHVPVEVSASDLECLAACPYQFYVQQVLKTRRQRLPSDDILPSDKGNLWHKIIAAFHQQRDVNNSTYDVELLQNIVRRYLEPLCAHNARYWAVLELFLDYANPYVAWWHAREAEGWQVKSSEAWIELAQEVHANGERKPLLWKGKIDQIDQRETLEPLTAQVKRDTAVIDYKTGSLSNYTRQIRDNNDVQLAFYLNLFSAEERATLSQAGYVGVSTEPVQTCKSKAHGGDNDYPQAWLNPEQNAPDNQAIQTAAQQLHQQVDDAFMRMYAGEALQAMGELTTCQRCHARGVCRKGYTVLF